MSSRESACCRFRRDIWLHFYLEDEDLPNGYLECLEDIHFILRDVHREPKAVFRFR